MAFLERDTHFAGYRIVRLIGEGRKAEVYEAVGLDGERVALKVVKHGFPLESKSQARLGQEGEAVAAIENVHVVGFRGADIEDGRVCVALELVRGPNLRQLLRSEGGALPVERAVRILRQACEGVAAAHALGILHRDLKPENILVGPEDLAKVVDFGSANMGELGVKTTGSESDLLASTYAPPELFLRRPIDARSDVYTMALVLYEAIAGFHPMAPGPTNMMQIATRQLLSAVPPLHTLGREVPLDVSALVRQAMSRDPAARPSMRELADGLAGALRWLHARRRAVAGGLALPNRPAALAPTEPAMTAFTAGGTMRMGVFGEEGGSGGARPEAEGGDRSAMVAPAPVGGGGPGSGEGERRRAEAGQTGNRGQEREAVSSGVPTWRSRAENAVAMAAVAASGVHREERERGSTTVPVESTAGTAGAPVRTGARWVWVGGGVVGVVGMVGVVVWVVSGGFGGGGATVVGKGGAAGSATAVVTAAAPVVGPSAVPAVVPSASASAGRGKGTGVPKKGVGPRRGPRGF